VGLRVCDRELTALLYLNDNWLPEHGGYLRLYRPEPGREEEVLLGASFFRHTHGTNTHTHGFARSLLLPCT
jgi:Rps23 Pro-64 3,4-dihydroxylase Tpa1-like proline 4-hydroxylase